jgi:hypothetical protein
MYGKIFASMYEGSMVGSGPLVFAVWGYCIAKADIDGTVLLNPALLAPVIGTSTESIRQAVDFLQQPDEHSKNPDHEGRRLLHQSGHLYFVVSHEIYRGMKSNEDRREYMREYMRTKRSKSDVNSLQSLQDLTKVNPASASVYSSAFPEGGCKGDAKSIRFSSPAVSEVADFCRIKGLKIDAVAFCAFYESKGWMVGKTKMKDWKAAAIGWNRRNKEQQTGPKPGYTIGIN